MRTDNGLDAILEQSLAQIAAGKARVESCLLAYPAYADELEPLLRAAEQVRALPKPQMAPEAIARIEAQVLTATPRGPLFRASLRPAASRRAVTPKWGWAMGAVAALVLLIFASVSLVQASARALPGMALYPVKLAVEDARLWLAPAEDEPALHLEFARRRLAEAEALAEQGRSDPAVLEAMAAHMQAALSGAEKLPPEAAKSILEELVALGEVQESALSRLAERLPPAERQAFRKAMGIGAAVAARARILLGLEPPDLEPGVTPVPSATSTSSATLAPAPSATSNPSATLMLTPSPTATPLPSRTLAPRSPTATLPPSPPPEVSIPTSTEEPAPVEPTEAPIEEPTDKPKNTPPAWGLTPSPWPPPTQHALPTTEP